MNNLRNCLMEFEKKIISENKLGEQPKWNTSSIYIRDMIPVSEGVILENKLSEEQSNWITSSICIRNMIPVSEGVILENKFEEQSNWNTSSICIRDMIPVPDRNIFDNHKIKSVPYLDRKNITQKLLRYESVHTQYSSLSNQTELIPMKSYAYAFGYMMIPVQKY